MSRRPWVLVAALLATAACTEPAFGKRQPEPPLNQDDASAIDAPASRVDAGERTPAPGVPTAPAGGPTKPGLVTTAVIGSFRTASQPRSAGRLTLHEDGFETGDTLCADKLCATGRFEP